MARQIEIRGEDLLRICPETVLAVDLDGTLVRVDMLRAGLGRLLRSEPRRVLSLGKCLLCHGRPGLKRAVAVQAPAVAEDLPYNPEVVSLARAWRTAGRKVVLATAADALVAEGIAAHLDLFDAVHASGNGCNLKGRAKAAFLVQEYGAKGFVYAGDSSADLHVWKHAAGAALARDSVALDARLRALGLPVQLVSPPKTGSILPASEQNTSRS